MSNLIQIIDKEFLEFSKNKNTTEKGNIFLKWFIKNIDNDIIANDDVDDVLVGKKNDCGIDGFYYDESSKVLRIYQSKFKIDGDDISSIEKNDFIELVERLSDEKSKSRWLQPRESLLDVSLVFGLKDCKKISFIYVTNCSELKMEQFQNTLNDVASTSLIVEDILVYSERSIMRKINGEVKHVIAKFVSQKGQYNKFDYETTDQKYKAYIMNISGEDLIKLSKQEYFNENIRFGLGNSKINKSITETANSDPELFWFFNNSVTIVCSQVVDNGGSFTLKQAQVVNGAQTIFALNKASKEKIKSVSVLAKVLELDDDNQILDNIVRYTNSQNKIDGWQFYSNRPFWSVLRKYFIEKSKGYIDLIYKSGITLPEELKNHTIVNKIRLTEFILAFVAYSGSPQLSKKGPSAVFKEDEDGKNILDRFFPEELLNFKNRDDLPEKELKEFYYILRIYVQLEKDNILKSVSEEILSGNERKNAYKGIETVLKHSRYYILYILNSRLSQIHNKNQHEFLSDIMENKLRDFVKLCTQKIFLEIWIDAIKNDPSITSNAPKFAKSEAFKKEIDKRLKNIDMNEILNTKAHSLGI